MSRALRDAPTAVVVTNERLPGEGARSLGGLALRHFAALRVAVAPVGPPMENLDGPRLPARLTVVKHKLGTPGGTADVDLVYGRGVDRAGELLSLGLAFGAIERCGPGLVFGREPLGKDARRARRRLAEYDGRADAVAAAIAAAPSGVGPAPPHGPAFAL